MEKVKKVLRTAQRIMVLERALRKQREIFNDLTNSGSSIIGNTREETRRRKLSRAAKRSWRNKTPEERAAWGNSISAGRAKKQAAALAVAAV